MDFKRTQKARSLERINKVSESQVCRERWWHSVMERNT